MILVKLVLCLLSTAGFIIYAVRCYQAGEQLFGWLMLIAALAGLGSTVAYAIQWVIR